MNRFYRWGSGLAAGLVFACAGAAFAEDITLFSADGSLQISGTLLDYDGEFYTIQSRFGELTLNALGLTCRGAACPDPGLYAADLSLSGTSALVLDLLPGLIEDFGFSTGHDTNRIDLSHTEWTYFIADKARIPVARLQATANNSTDAIGDLIHGDTDLAFATRRPDKDELKAAKKAKIGEAKSPFRQQIIAIDALVFIVSKSNPVSALSLADIAAIYAGKISNWSELGGYDAPIAVFHQLPDSDLAAAFSDTAFPETPNQPLRPGRIFSDARDLSDAVAQDPFAIGYTSFGAIRNARVLSLKGDCGILQPADSFSLKAGDYPLIRFFYAITPSRRLPLFARNFLAYLDGDPAQQSIADLGFVAQDIEHLSLSEQQDRLSNAIMQADDEVGLEDLRSLVATFQGAERLSATFRFMDGSTKMDARSSRNLRILSQMIETGDFDGRELVLAGFSDSQGGKLGNQRLSRQRADLVLSALKTRATRANLSRVTFTTVGLGEISPLACNDDEAGRRLNRRVEIWLR